MQNIPGIGASYTSGINGYSNRGNSETNVTEEDAKPQSQENPSSSVSADDVMTFLAASNIGAVAQTNSTSAPKVIRVSDYVDAESAARIAESMGVFLSDTAPLIAEGLQNGLSESAAQVVAAAAFENENYL